jgi:hypothetical protein
MELPVLKLRKRPRVSTLVIVLLVIRLFEPPLSHEPTPRDPLPIVFETMVLLLQPDMMMPKFMVLFLITAPLLKVSLTLLMSLKYGFVVTMLQFCTVALDVTVAVDPTLTVPCWWKLGIVIVTVCPAQSNTTSSAVIVKHGPDVETTSVVST